MIIDNNTEKWFCVDIIHLKIHAFESFAHLTNNIKSSAIDEGKAIICDNGTEANLYLKWFRFTNKLKNRLDSCDPDTLSSLDFDKIILKNKNGSTFELDIKEIEEIEE